LDGLKFEKKKPSLLLSEGFFFRARNASNKTANESKQSEG
jgi:hypothetical protein